MAVSKTEIAGKNNEKSANRTRCSFNTGLSLHALVVPRLFYCRRRFSMKVPAGCPTPEKSAANPIGVTTANTTVEIKVKLSWFSQIVNVSRLPALDTPVIC